MSHLQFKKTSYWFFGLTGIQFFFGILAILRTGSLIPLLILGSFALMTLLLGIGIYRSSRVAVQIGLAWLTLIVIVQGHEIFWQNPGHTNPQPGHEIVFVLLTLSALTVLVVLFSRYRRLMAAAD